MDNTEKISVNMNIGTLSQIDMLVDQGYYSNRSDFINQAVREALHQRRDDVQAIKKQNTLSGNIWFMGINAIPMGRGTNTSISHRQRRQVTSRRD